VTQPAPLFRSNEQVLYDLSKALHFSPESLEINRRGRVSSQQIKRLSVRCVRHALLASIFLFLPLFLWMALTSAREQEPFLSTAPILFNDLLHLSDSVEAHGRFGALFRLVTILGGLAMGLYMVSRFPFALYFDLLDGTVVLKEGRIVAREEQTLRANGRDPVEKYFLDIKTERFEVNLAAYRAVENGAMYLVYLLPRSQVLVSLEPRVANSAEPSAGVA
jgi:hypothetical protein